MITQITISVFLILQIIFFVPSKAVPSPQPSTCSDLTRQNLLKGNAAFTGKFLHEAYKHEPTKNQIMSPFSIFVPIGELALYAKENTYNQLTNALNLKNNDEIRCAFPKLTSLFRDEEDVILNTAARIFASHKNPLTKEFLGDTRNVFEAEAENLNFDQPEGAAKRINEWVESQTNNRIKDIATPDMINARTRLVLANAIYFLGDWEYSFDDISTEDRDFYVNSNTTIRIPTMQQTNDDFKYANVESLDCKVLEMTYRGNNFSFVVFLPNKKEGLGQLVEKLQDPITLYAAYDSMDYEYVDVHLPKMKIESEFDLADLLPKIGISDVFHERLSKLSNILEKDEPLYVSAAKQKAFIEVNEKGTEAAAANIFALIVATSVGSGPPPAKPFYADHPFAFYIMYKRDIIFSGVFVNE